MMPVQKTVKLVKIAGDPAGLRGVAITEQSEIQLVNEMYTQRLGVLESNN